MSVELVVYRYGNQESNFHDTVGEAARLAVYMIEYNEAYPDVIKQDGEVVWKNSDASDFEELEALAGTEDTE